MIRLFIALPLKKEVVEKLNDIITELKSYGGRVKYVNPENIHLTLKFLGNTEENIVDDIKKQIENISSLFQSIKTSSDNIGVFPNWNRPRVIWVGMEHNRNQLVQLAADIESSLEPLGWQKDDKEFHSHLTLGRIKDNRGLEDLVKFAQNFKVKPFPIEFDRIVLFQSTLTKQGPIYKALHEVKLGERFG